MGLLLDWLQPDKEKQSALSQSLISGGLAMLAGGKQDFGTSLAQGVGAGVKTYAEKFEEARKKALAMAPYKAAMTPAKPAVPAVYNVGGKSLPQLGQAQDVAQNMYNLPQAANPYKPPEQDMTGEALGMPASLMPQEMGIEDFSGGQPGQIEEVAAQPAQATSFDRNKYLEAVIQAGPEHPLFTEANKMMLEQRKPIVLGKSLIDPETNKVIATDETWREEKDVARQQRMEEIKMQLEDKRMSREMQADLRRELADQQAALRREMAQSRTQAASNPYYTPIQTAQGVMSFNARTGRMEPVKVNGAPIVGSSSDPTLQGRIASSKKEGLEIGEQKSMIVGKENSIEAVKKAKTYLDDGIYAGAWGPLTKEAIKRIPGTDRAKAARTEAFVSEIGNVVIPRLKEFGGNDSNEEMKYLQRVMGGDISMEPAALKEVLDSAEKKIQRGIDRLHQDGKPRLSSPNTQSTPKNLPQKKGAIPAGWTVKER